jgi:hypothetical protein
MRIGIIGSVACATILERTPNDIDLVGTYEDLLEYFRGTNIKEMVPMDGGKKLKVVINVGYGQHDIFDCEIAWPGSNSEELLNIIFDDKYWHKSRPGSGSASVRYATPDICYLLKMSHRFKKNSPHFLKTRADILKMRWHGCRIPKEYKTFFKRREKEALSYAHPKLNSSKKAFFTDNVPYVYDHDSIHEAIALYDEPAYKKYQVDGEEVLTSKNKFFACHHGVRLAGVYEEACVLAIERALVPHPDKNTPETAFLKALEKVCTSITSGWFREFAWERYDEVVRMYHTYPCYWKRFNEAVKEGKVKNHEQ